MPSPPPHRFEQVTVDQLRFDPENPRLPPNVNGEDELAVVEWMLSDAGLLELMGSIAHQGYFPGDPLLVCPWSENGDEPVYDADAEFKVVEGNRRLAALKLLSRRVDPPKRRESVLARADEASEQNLESVPCVLFAHRADVLDYLGFRHITGIKEWDPLEKARFLRQLRDRAAEAGEPMSNRDLARAIGSKGPYVGRLLAALAALEKLEQIPALREAVDIDDLPFSLLVAALNHDRIAYEFLRLDSADDPDLTGVDTEALADLGRWLFIKREDGRTALEDSRNLGWLGEIATHPDARAALDEGAPIHSAVLLAHTPEILIGEAFAEAYGPLSIADERADDLSTAPEPLVETAREIRSHSESIHEKLLAKSA